MKPDPIGEPRNSLAIFLLVLSLLSGLLLLVGVPSAGSIEAELPRIASLTWGGILTIGALLVLIGMFWQGDRGMGLLVKRIGFLCLVVASTVYAVTLFLFIGIRGTFAASMVLGYGTACGVQYRKVNRVIRQAIEASK